MKQYTRIVMVAACVFAVTGLFAVFANEKPTVQIISAAMRPDTTLMDITYRVDDSDDATVKVRALAFVDGVRSFSNVIRPVTWAEDTEANLGDAITTGVNHALTWNVGADWNVSLGNLKFEILCRDNRGLLSFDWITIPAAGGHPALTISKSAPSDTEVLDALFWQYSDFDPGMILNNGVLTGSSGEFNGIDLLSGQYGAFYIAKQMNLALSPTSEVSYAANKARADLNDTTECHIANRPYVEPSVIVWGGASNTAGLVRFTTGLGLESGVTAISGGRDYSLALKNDGTVSAWGLGVYGVTTIPASLTNVIAISAGRDYGLALKANGTVTTWGNNGYGLANIPASLTNVTAIAASDMFSLALKADGTVVSWGSNTYAATVASLTNVAAIAAGGQTALALKSDGKVVKCGGGTTPPAGLTNVTAIAVGKTGNVFLALKSDGTVVGWGINTYGQMNIPAGLTNVTAIAAGSYHCLALKADGTVVGWGRRDGYDYGQATIPQWLTNVTAIAAGASHSVAIVNKTP